jgi:ABC-type transport system substrate-binding protein
MMHETSRNTLGRSLSRRSLLGAAALSGVGVAATLAGCSKANSPAPATNSTSPRRGGVFNRTGGFPLGFDGHQLSPAVASLTGFFYQSLLRFNRYSYQVEPELAERWEQPSPTELVLSLAPNIKWHNRPPVNGRALTADDVVFNFNRLRTSDPKFIASALGEPIARCC